MVSKMAPLVREGGLSEVEYASIERLARASADYSDTNFYIIFIKFQYYRYYFCLYNI